jgi:sRNA-binding protein
MHAGRAQGATHGRLLNGTEHQEQVMPHYHRDDRELFLRHLADQYPKCFFLEPALRRPLSKNILSDLDRARALDPEKCRQAVEYYENHFNYQRAILTGAERVGLHGERAGTCTLQEQENARKRVLERKKHLAEEREMRERETETRAKEAAIRAASVTSNGSNGHAVTQVAPPPTVPAVHPDIVPLQDAVTAAGEVLSNKPARVDAHRARDRGAQGSHQQGRSHYQLAATNRRTVMNGLQNLLDDIEHAAALLRQIPNAQLSASELTMQRYRDGCWPVPEELAALSGEIAAMYAKRAEGQ